MINYKTWQPSQFEVLINCIIHKITEAQGVWQSAVCLEPLGSNKKFWAEGSDTLAMRKDVIGRVVSADLKIQFSTVRETGEREFSVTIKKGDDFDTVKAVGQYIGTNGDRFLFHSLFVVCVDDEFCAGMNPPKEIGDWVEIEGSFDISWNSNTDVFL